MFSSYVQENESIRLIAQELEVLRIKLLVKKIKKSLLLG